MLLETRTAAELIKADLFRDYGLRVEGLIGADLL